MKPHPFDPATDNAPVPFDPAILSMAGELKQHGLEFRPHAGCFVWDPDEVITVPSPFPHRVYFILNRGRFESIFGSLEEIVAKLVWIPTETQARTVIGKLGGDPEVPARGTVDLYRQILELLDRDV